MALRKVIWTETRSFEPLLYIEGG